MPPHTEVIHAQLPIAGITLTPLDDFICAGYRSPTQWRAFLVGALLGVALAAGALSVLGALLAVPARLPAPVLAVSLRDSEPAAPASPASQASAIPKATPIPKAKSKAPATPLAQSAEPVATTPDPSASDATGEEQANTSLNLGEAITAVASDLAGEDSEPSAPETGLQARAQPFDPHLRSQLSSAQTERLNRARAKTAAPVTEPGIAGQPSRNYFMLEGRCYLHRPPLEPGYPPSVNRVDCKVMRMEKSLDRDSIKSAP